MKNFREWCLENKKYTLLTLYENAKNLYKSDEIGFSTSKLVNWKCTKCGMEWSLSTNHMNRKKNPCSYCAHKKPSPFYNIETEVPPLAKEWNYEKNLKKPTEYLHTSHESVWWKCDKGHEWEAVIRDRVKSVKANIKRGRPICPYCNHEKISSTYNLFTESPDIARQWNYRLNGSLTPLNVSPKSKERVWWTCEYDSTHVWKSRISNRTALNRGCPKCAKNVKTSFPERALYYYLKLCFNDCELGKRFLKYSLDIFIPSHKIVIEYDGWYYHSDKASKEREKRKDMNLSQFEIIRIKETTEEINEFIYDMNTIKYHPLEGHENLDEIIKEVLKLIEKKTNVKLNYDVDFKRDYRKIQEMYYHIRKSNSLAVKRPDLTKEWSENNTISPDNITLGSSYPAKWICPKCHHEYVATIPNRANNNSNCPKCWEERRRKKT